MTRTEKRLVALANKRQRIKTHIKHAGKNHKARKYLQSRHVAATVELLRAELRLEKARAA